MLDLSLSSSLTRSLKSRLSASWPRLRRMPSLLYVSCPLILYTCRPRPPVDPSLLRFTRLISVITESSRPIPPTTASRNPASIASESGQPASSSVKKSQVMPLQKLTNSIIVVLVAVHTHQRHDSTRKHSCCNSVTCNNRCMLLDWSWYNPWMVRRLEEPKLASEA